MKHRLFASILALTMTLVPLASEPSVTASAPLFAVSAEESTPAVWNGSADTSWYYKEHQVLVIPGETETDEPSRIHVFDINTAEELAGLAKLVRNGNSMQNTVINLRSDIVLNDTSHFDNWENEPPANNWIAIGAVSRDMPFASNNGLTIQPSSPCTSFEGRFNGCGHSITGMYSYHQNYAGLFARVAGIVTNVRVRESYVNCVNTQEDNSSQLWETYAGGIAAVCERGIINMCEFDGSVRASGLNRSGYGTHGGYAGGIAGYFSDDLGGVAMVFYSVFLPGIIINPLYLMAGMPEETSTPGIYNCINRGDVYEENGTWCNGAGGMVGTGGLLGTHQKSSPFALYHCLNLGSISANHDRYGAMVGNGDENCNFGEIGCFYTGCDRSSQKNEATNITEAGLSMEETAEQLGESFLCENGEISLNFANLSDSGTLGEGVTTETETFTDAQPAVNVTRPAPTLHYKFVNRFWVDQYDSVSITPEGDADIGTWICEVYDDPAYTDRFQSETFHSYANVENLRYDKTYYVRVRGWTNDSDTENREYTDWAYLNLRLSDPDTSGDMAEPSTEPVVSEIPDEVPTEATPTEAATAEVTEATAEAAEATEATETTEATEAATDAADTSSLITPSFGCYPNVNDSGVPGEILQWNSVDGVSGYEYETSSTTDFATISYHNRFSADVTKIRLTETTPGKKYYVRMRTYLDTEDGDRIYSPYAYTCFTGMELPAEDTALAAPDFYALQVKGMTRYSLWWKTVEGATAYQVELAAAPDFGTVLISRSVEPKDSDYQNISCKYLKQGRIYYVRIRAVSEQEGETITSDATYATFQIPTAFRILYGDTDSSAIVNAGDASAILVDAASVGAGEKTALSTMQRIASDLNDDGSVDAADASELLIYAAAVGAGDTRSAQEYFALEE